jgi:shikimate kinase / 3-dehydroquinate synthase
MAGKRGVRPVSRPALVFIGFMGAGKSTALGAAREAGLETIEIDDLMEGELGMPIKEAFERQGEEAFREREAEVVGALLERADGGAIALGGGSVLSRRIRSALERHIVVWLQVDAGEAWRRIAHSDRPLATSAEDVERLLSAREPLYDGLADAVVPVGDRGMVSRALPAIQALVDLPAGTKLLWAASASGEYPIYIGSGLLKSLGGEGEGGGHGREWWPLEGRRFCVSDKTVMQLYADLLQPLAGRVEVEPGEATKSMETASAVLEALADAEMTREDHVVALGGGVVGDLAGFCAHLYQRGVPVVQVPTTVVAQVDSAYGGKTGVDLPQGKNYAGAYHLPAAVIADTDTLATLPLGESKAGFVEVLKTGLLAGGKLWEEVRSAGAVSDELVFSCARYKGEVVAADERDGGLRHVLNLGHTVGHALEAATGYERYRHGEAVGLGLLAALSLSDAPKLRDEVEQILLSHNLPVAIDAWISVDAILEALQRDKKRTAAGVGFVLLPEPGAPRTGQIVNPTRVRAVVEDMRR